jgi:uncharacterized protein
MRKASASNPDVRLAPFLPNYLSKKVNSDGLSGFVRKERGMKLLLPMLFACLWAAAVQAASFNCAHALLPAEQTICANTNLSKLDEQTAGMYFLIVGSGAPQTTVSQVKTLQAKFIAQRNACGTDVDCLVDAYTSQMMYLKNEKGNLGL